MPKAKSSSNEVDASPVSYEAAMQELEALTLKMESGQLPLDQLLSGYARGAANQGAGQRCVETLE